MDGTSAVLDHARDFLPDDPLNVALADAGRLSLVSGSSRNVNEVVEVVDRVGDHGDDDDVGYDAAPYDLPTPYVEASPVSVDPLTHELSDRR
jgi:hypothetical protein